MDDLRRGLLRGWLGPVLVLVLASSGCPKDRDATRPTVVPPEVIEKLASWVRHQVPQMTGRPCKRPPLRGEVRGGPAAGDQLAVLNGVAGAGACLDAVEKLDREDPDWLQALLPAKAPADRAALQRKWPVARLPQAGEGQVFDSLREACQPLFLRLNRAVSHGNACNPYRPGLRCAPDGQARVRIARAAVASAASAFAAGQHRDAFLLLLDTMRFEQDLLAGGATWAEVGLSLRAYDLLVPLFEAMLNAPAPLAGDLLDQVDRELGQILDSVTHPVSLLLAEYLHQALGRFMTAELVRRPAALSPGGLCPAADSAPPGADADSWPVSVADRRALIWVAAERSFRESVLVCRPDRPARRCGQELGRLHAKYQAVLDRDATSYLRMQLRNLLADDQLASLRGQAARVLADVGPMDSRAVARFGQIHFALAGLRTLAAFRALVERSGACPDLGAFQTGHLAEVRVNPYGGVPVDVLLLGPGSYGLAPTDPLLPGQGPGAQPSLRALCPNR